MIDGIKTYDLKTDPQKLIENSYLDGHWKTTIQNSDSEIEKEFAEYFGLTFRIKHKKVRLQGSVHKYRNLGKHNYNDFRAVDVAEVVHELESNLKINLYSNMFAKIGGY